MKRIGTEEYISFGDFEALCQVINNIEDFHVIIRLFMSVGENLQLSNFKRAIKICSSENTLHNSVVELLYRIFTGEGK